ncbi:MAG: fibronectin type III domain-containing protein [Nitrospirae bacterium]|nr:fibronectin type III domain-containing protein [Nitrospirota bacterium]
MKIPKIAGLLIAVFVVTACGGGNNDNSTPTFSAPTGVKVAIMPDTGSGKTFKLTWNPVTDAVKYNIYMASEKGVTKLNVTSLAGNMTHLDIIDSFLHPLGLNPDTIFYFVVTAVNTTAEETVESCEAAAKLNGVDGNC